MRLRRRSRNVFCIRLHSGVLAPGFSLTEVLIGITLLSVIVISIFGVTLTVRKSSTRSDHYVAAKYTGQLVLERLKNYVVATNDPVSPSNDPAISTKGPGPGGNWSLPGDTCCWIDGSNCCANAPNCYALDWRCVHTIDPLASPSIIPATLPGATVYYQIVGDESGNPTMDYWRWRPKVQVTVLWTEQ